MENLMIENIHTVYDYRKTIIKCKERNLLK